MNNVEQVPAVEHNVGLQQFEVQMDGKLCVAEYQLRNGQMIFTHTYVPPELRGRGIAEKLVRAALDYAREHKLRVVPACSYVAVFLERHREYHDLAA